MSALPEISIVLPVYNGSKTVEKSIMSIVNQTFQNWELVIVDDGSVDDSFHLCQEIAQQEKRISLYKNETNLGLAATMNRLVGLAKGKYIGVQEHDDFAMPYRLQMEWDLLESKPEIGLVSGIAELLDDDGQVFMTFPGILANGNQYPQDKKQMVAYLFINHTKVVNAACMFRKSIVDAMPMPFDEQAKQAIDLQFFLHLSHKARVWGLQKALVRMSRGEHHAHITKKKDLQFRETRRCIKKIYHEYKNDPTSPINRRLYFQSMSHELNLEGRVYGRFKGIWLILQAIVYNPANKNAWKSLYELTIRGLRKSFQYVKKR